MVDVKKQSNKPKETELFAVYRWRLGEGRKEYSGDPDEHPEDAAGRRMGLI